MSDAEIGTDSSGSARPPAAADADLEWLSLEPDEAVRWRGNPRIQSAVPWIGLAVIAIAGIAVAVLATPLPSFALLFVPLVVAGAALAVVDVRRTEYAVTTEAVVARRGVFGVSVSVIELEHVQNTSASQHALGRLVGYGTVEVDSAGGDGSELRFRDIEDPQSVRRLIDRQRERADASEVPGSLEEWELVLAEVRGWRLALESE